MRVQSRAGAALLHRNPAPTRKGASMSIVIPFAPRARSTGANPTASVREPAQILFFTGVRYERQDETAAADLRAPRRRRPSRTTARPKSAGHQV